MYHIDTSTQGEIMFFFFISLQQRKSIIELHTILLHNSDDLLSKFGIMINLLKPAPISLNRII